MSRDGALLAFQKEALLALNNQAAAKTAGPQSEAERNQAYQYFYDDTYTYSRYQDYRHTVDAATRALAVRPDALWVLRMRAGAYVGLKQYSKAIDDLTKGLADNTTVGAFKSDFYTLRSIAWKNLGQLDRAKADASDAARFGYQLQRQNPP